MSSFVRIVHEKVGVWPNHFQQGQVVAKSLLVGVDELTRMGAVVELPDGEVPADAIHGEDTITPIVSVDSLVTTVDKPSATRARTAKSAPAEGQ